MSKRIGVFGGTFDPIHHGHLIIAGELRYNLGLDLVLFLPAGRPPHKSDREITLDQHRIAMLDLVLSRDASFDLSYVDVQRDGPSYTADSLRVHQDLYPDSEIVFLMGQDSFRDLPYWHEPAEIARLTRIGVALRPGVVVDVENIFQRVPGVEGRVDFVDVPLIQIASSDIRRRVRSSEPIRYHVPIEVEEYIREHKLYLPG